MIPFESLDLRTAGLAISLGLAALSAGQAVSAESNPLTLSGAGWTQFGMIVKSLDTVESKKLDNRSLLATGAQFALRYQASEKLEIGAGVGVGSGHSIAANRGNGFFAPFGTGPYVSAASAKYSFWNGDDGKLFLQSGLFPFDYATDAQNLGLYLLRGPVYPGYLMSGFETKYVLPVANFLGFQLHHQTGGFEQDLLFSFETDWYPYWDISPAYMVAYKPVPAFKIGGGINFYHYIPIDPQLTSDTVNANSYIKDRHITTPRDTIVQDTTFISFKGIKVGANFSFDPKPLLGGIESLGPDDLKLYGEAAIIGLDNDQAHKDLYGGLSKRMPIMLGFNLPVFKFLDKLSAEVEYHDAPWDDNPAIYNTTSGNEPSPIPAAKLDTNVVMGKYRWSLYGSKTLAGHVKLSVQAASDHFRPGIFAGYGDNYPPGRQAIFYKANEWYWTTKIAYFF